MGEGKYGGGLTYGGAYAERFTAIKKLDKRIIISVNNIIYCL